MTVMLLLWHALILLLQVPCLLYHQSLMVRRNILLSGTIRLMVSHVLCKFSPLAINISSLGNLVLCMYSWKVLFFIMLYSISVSAVLLLLLVLIWLIYSVSIFCVLQSYAMVFNTHMFFSWYLCAHMLNLIPNLNCSVSKYASKSLNTI